MNGFYLICGTLLCGSGLCFASTHDGSASGVLCLLVGLCLGFCLGLEFFKRWGDPKLMRGIEGTGWKDGGE